MASEISCNCTRRLVIQIFDAGSLMVVLVLQGSILNYYIISHYKSSVNPYFWFIADFACLFVFAGAFTKSYGYLKRTKESRSMKIKNPRAENNSPGLLGYNSGSTSGSQHLSRASSLKRLGLPEDIIGPLPLCYSSWLIYAIILTCKLGIILKSEIPDNLDKSDTFGPQMLKITIGLSAIIFLLLVEGHSGINRDPQLVHSTCSRCALELLDTISFLSILLVKETNVLEDFVVALTAVNFLLPTLPLYALSVTGFGARHIPLVLSIARNLLHLCLLDIPYLAVRVYFWAAYQQDISMFVIKNVLGIIFVIRTMYPDIKLLCKWRRNRVVRESSKVERIELQKVNSSHPQSMDSEGEFQPEVAVNSIVR